MRPGPRRLALREGNGGLFSEGFTTAANRAAKTAEFPSPGFVYRARSPPGVDEEERISMSTTVATPPAAPEDTAKKAPPTRRRRKRLVLMVLATPVVLLAAVYVLFFTPDSPARLRLSAPAPSESGDMPAVATGRWSVGAGSVAGYRVREKLLRLPAPNDAVGRTGAIVGDLHLVSDGRGIVVQKGMRVDVDVSTLKSDEARRDDHMRTMAIETDKFPTATFVSTADLVVPPTMMAGAPATVTVQGDLTVHGVTRRVSIPVDAQRNGPRIEVVGAFSFGWELFGMERPNLSYVTVEADPTLELQLFFDHESALVLTGVGSDDSSQV
jgi:hypothetical protein